MLGRGGMGVVLEAHDATLDRNVALKLLSSSAARHSEARLLREAQALARLSHPNVVQVYDIGEVDGQTFIAMELVRGLTLRVWARERHPWRTTVAVYRQAALGLAAAHDKGLVHRDFKPENCILDDEGRVRVLDFGLARKFALANASSDSISISRKDVRPTRSSPVAPRQADGVEAELRLAETQDADPRLVETRDVEPRQAQEPDAHEPDAHEPDAHEPDSPLAEGLTRDGVMLGTLGYMSFEQLLGQQADALSDQYAFCASLYEALCGEAPYPGKNPTALYAAMMDDERRPPPPGIKLPRRLLRALWRGLAKDPSQRWPSMTALVAELDALTRARRPQTVVMMLAVGASLAVGAASFYRDSPNPCPDIDTALEGTWGDQARAQLAAAFETHGSADDPLLLPRVVERLDAHALAWATMTRDSCLATYVARRQSEARLEQRTRCLERNRNRFVATVSTLANAKDAETLAQAIVLPFRLPALDPCGEAALAEPEAVLVDAHDPRTVGLRRTIDEAITLREAGQLDEALALAATAHDEALELDDPGLLAEALECLGRAQTERGVLVEAQATLEQAIMAATTVEDDLTVARAWASLVFVATARGNHDEAEHYVLPAEAAVVRSGDAVLHAWLVNSRGVLASERGQHALAQQKFEQALALKQAALGTEHVDVGIAWHNLGLERSYGARHHEATEALAQARAIFEATVGKNHPMTIHAIANQCESERRQGHTSEAIVLCEQAIDRLASAPLDPQRESRVRVSLTRALWNAGRTSEARAMASHAARLIEHQDPELQDPELATWIQDWLATHPERTDISP